MQAHPRTYPLLAGSRYSMTVVVVTVVPWPIAPLAPATATFIAPTVTASSTPFPTTIPCWPSPSQRCR